MKILNWILSPFLFLLYSSEAVISNEVFKHAITTSYSVYEVHSYLLFLSYFLITFDEIIYMIFHYRSPAEILINIITQLIHL